jgi:thiamine biosynthesis lipoprotein ApbE
LRINLVLLLGLACAGESRPPASRAWPAMGTMMAIAAWGADTARVARALEAAHDSVERIDSLVQRQRHFAAIDSARAEVRERSGVALPPDSVAIGYALDRAALALTPADSALLTLDDAFRWIGAASRSTHRSVGIPDPDNTLHSLGAVEMWSGAVRSRSQRDARGAAVKSVTVLAATAILADAWTAAFMVVGCDSALALAPKLARPESRVSVVCADSAGVRSTTDLGQRFRVARSTGRAP